VTKTKEVLTSHWTILSVFLFCEVGMRWLRQYDACRFETLRSQTICFFPTFFFFGLGPSFNNHWRIVYAFVQSICGITQAPPTEKSHKKYPEWKKLSRMSIFAHDRVIVELNTMKQK
jgi:hypothetical protein